MRRVAIIGAGIIGASVAYRLAEAGIQVILIDRGDPAQGTTSSTFAWANSNQKEPRDYFELNFAGLREHKQLADELGSAPWLHCDGNLIWTRDQHELEARVARLHDWGYAAEWLTATEVNRSLEPRLRFPDPELRVAFFPDECWVDAPQLALDLIERARRKGAETHFGEAVTAIEYKQGQVVAVTLSRQGRIEVDAVVNAAGPAAGAIASMVGRVLPLAPTTGLLVRIAAGSNPVSRVIHSPHMNVRPDGDGYILLQHDSIDAELGRRRQVTPGDRLALESLRRCEEILGELKGASVVDARVGTRPYPADGHSCVGGVSGIDGYYEAVTHSGITLGPLLGRLLASEIADGTVDPLLGSFRPDRFSGTA